MGHSNTMRFVLRVVLLGLGLTLALPEYKEREQGPHNELEQESNLDNKGLNQDNELEQDPMFNAVKDVEQEQMVEVQKRAAEDEDVEQEQMVEVQKRAAEDEDLVVEVEMVEVEKRAARSGHEWTGPGEDQIGSTKNSKKGQRYILNTRLSLILPRRFGGSLDIEICYSDNCKTHEFGFLGSGFRGSKNLTIN